MASESGDKMEQKRPYDLCAIEELHEKHSKNERYSFTERKQYEAEHPRSAYDLSIKPGEKNP